MKVSAADSSTDCKKEELNIRKQIRNYELEQVIKHLPANSRILEIGAGAGWQARTLSERGFDVDAIDIPESNYVNIREWKVCSYDGVTIPFDNDTFDVVFSSNVLEHVPHVETFQKEIARVLKSDGIAIHVMPSTIWRLSTFLTFYPDRIKKIFLKIFKIKDKDSNASIKRVSESKKTALDKIKTILIPPRHGETGSAFSELYLFSSYRWRRCFKKTGWNILKVEPCGLFYSGQKLLGKTLPLEKREKIAKFFGSSCTIFLMKK